MKEYWYPTFFRNYQNINADFTAYSLKSKLDLKDSFQVK
jgi:hypothetical protein